MSLQIAKVRDASFAEDRPSRAVLLGLSFSAPKWSSYPDRIRDKHLEDLSMCPHKMRAKIGLSLLVPLSFALSIYCSFLAFRPAKAEIPRETDLGLELESRVVDFGAVEQNRNLQRQFTLHNRSTAVVVVREVAKSCGCTTAELSTHEIAPGETALLDVSWDTRNLRGRNTEAVGIVYSRNAEAETSTLPLTLTADVQPNVKSSTDRVEFESTQPTTKTIAFQRADASPLKITSSRASQPAIQVTHDGTEVMVTFDPKNYRPESGALFVSIWTDCSDEPYITIPVSLRK